LPRQSRGGKGTARLRRQWFAKRKNVIALLRETIFQQESPLVDTDASNKAADADAPCRSWAAIKSPSATSPPR
jgi:type IV secretion system protein VirB4